MTIRHLKTFIKVCEYMNITKAAHELNIAQPSVTQTIKELESYYGVILFDRINQRLILTDCGKDLLVKAKEIVNSFDDFEMLVKHKELNPSIKIGASLTFGKRFIPSFLKIIKKDFPNVDTYVYINKVAEIENKILSGDLDFALTESIITSRNINALTFKKDRVIVVAGKDYNIESKIKFKDIVKYPLILREKGSATRNLLDNKLQQYNEVAKPFVESCENNAIISIAKNNLGVAILPFVLVKEYLDKKILKEIELDTILERNLSIITHKNKEFNSVQKEIFNKCIKYAKSLNIITK